MALILLAGAGYAMYKQKQEQEPVIEFKDYPLDPAVLRFFDTDGENRDDDGERNDGSKNKNKIEFVDFLPSELSMGQYSNSLTTITFYEGDYRKIQNRLERRVNEVLKMNPWLGGRLAVKPGEEQLRLWYDPNCNDVPSDIYTCHEPGVIPLKRSTKYVQYKDHLADYSVVVPCVNGLVGKDHPVWKVTVVPDVIEQNERFAIIVSQSHMIGDSHTYYKIFHMLFNSSNEDNKKNPKRTTSSGLVNTAPVEKMNPIRRADVKYHIEKHMGVQEASYILKTNPNMVDEMYEKVTSTAEDTIASQKKQTMLFTVSERWLKTKMEECITAKKEEDQKILINKIAAKKEEEKKRLINKIDRFIDDGENTLDSPNHGGETLVAATIRNLSSGSVDVSNNDSSSNYCSSSRKAARSTSASSVDKGDSADDIHPTDVLLSWWFQTSEADIGL